MVGIEAKSVFVLLCELCFLIWVRCDRVQFDTVICFGDSNSDNGNVFSLTNGRWPVVPPYYQGHFSNGPMWTDRLGVINMLNFAYGSATSDNNLVQGYTAFNTPVPGVRQQIALYRNRTNVSQVDFLRTAYFIWAGANDYFFNLTITSDLVVNSLMNSVQDLIQMGGKYIFIMNQPPIDKQPAVMTFNLPLLFVNLVQTHNANLSSAVQSLQSNVSNVVLRIVDLNTLIGNILSNMSAYGMISTNKCWDTSNGTVVPLCSTPDAYIYLDEYHFTTRIHQFIADYVRPFLVTSQGQKSFTSNIFLLFLALIFSPVRLS